MIGENYTAFYLKNRNITLKDDVEEDIPALKFPSNSQKIFNIIYSPQFISFDVLAKKNKLKPRKLSILRYYSDLERRGFAIISVPIKNRWFSKQHVIYKIKKISSIPKGTKVIAGIPSKHRIEFDEANNQLRLVGQNVGVSGYGEWINVAPTKTTYLVTPKTAEEKMARMYGDIFLNESRRYKIRLISINDLPIMMNHEGKIVCIPWRQDAITVGVTGIRGTGKSLLLQLLADLMFWRWKARCWVANDNMQETVTWTEPNHDFATKLKALNISPIGLPVVMVLPYSNTLNLKRFNKETPIVVMALPLVEMIKRLKLGGSEIYFQNIIDDLIDCEDEKEVFTLIDEKIQTSEQDEQTKKGFFNMKIKIKNYLRHLFSKKLCDLDVLNERTEFGNIVVRMRYGDEISSVFPTLMMAGCIPCLNTFDLLQYDKKQYQFEYLESIYQGIYDWQNQLPENNRVQVYGFIDELQKIMSVGKNKNPAGEALGNMVLSGRPIQIGLVYATPNYKRISSEIRKGTTYLIALRQKSRDECVEIEKDFVLEKTHVDKMLSFQKFEGIALTTEDRGFAIYDEFGNRELTSKPQMGTIFPSLSLHKKPA